MIRSWWLVEIRPLRRVPAPFSPPVPKQELTVKIPSPSHLNLPHTGAGGSSTLPTLNTARNKWLWNSNKIISVWQTLLILEKAKLRHLNCFIWVQVKLAPHGAPLSWYSNNTELISFQFSFVNTKHPAPSSSSVRRDQNTSVQFVDKTSLGLHDWQDPKILEFKTISWRHVVTAWDRTRVQSVYPLEPGHFLLNYFSWKVEWALSVGTRDCGMSQYLLVNILILSLPSLLLGWHNPLQCILLAFTDQHNPTTALTFSRNRNNIQDEKDFLDFISFS